MWFYYTILAAFFVALWGVLVKMATKSTSFWLVAFISPLIAAIVIAATFLVNRQIEYTNKGIYFAILSGVFLGLFYLLYAKGVSVGPVSKVYIVQAIGSLLIVGLIGILLLKEKFSITYGTGILLAIISIILLSIGSN